MLDFAAVFAEHREVIASLDSMIPLLHQAVEHIVRSIKAGGTVFWMGNGGSAADAQHMAAELIGRFKQERIALPSIALTTDTSILTCVGNDYGFDKIFARQLEGLCKAKDTVIGLSTSGNSENILQGIAVAKARGAYTIGFTGHQGGALKKQTDLCFVVPSTTTARIQEAHSLLCHCLCEAIEAIFSAMKKST